MGIFTRYIARELLKVFLLALIAMTTLMLLVFLIYEAMRQGLGAGAALRLIPYMLPHALCFAIPGTILFSVCSVFGRMSAANEVVAIKSLGISPKAILVPVIVLGFLLSMLTVWLNDVAFSWGREKAYQVVLQSVEKTIYGILRSKGRYDNGKFSINVLAVEDKTLVRPIVVIREHPHAPPQTITAERAVLDSVPAEGILNVRAYQGTFQKGNLSFAFDDEETIGVPLVNLTKKDRGQKSPSDFAIHQIAGEIEAEKQRVREHQQDLALLAAIQLGSGDLQQLHSQRWIQESQALRLQQTRVHRLGTETWRRFASGFSCLFFVVVGAPLAIRLRTADVWNSFALCFFPILIVYYPLLAFGLDRAKSGELPPYVVWVGNLVLGLIGLFLYRRVIRY